ncbi:asparagine synthase (glutamine-hydrolyzing) [Algibacter mikhailovii]|uniref:asparagine synthase (glutamine-hydrolyzing) n=1 Tax=Algibacter mikhailovii TaxID=425498 RepID=A0A918V9A1_9FLAO|nr:asparagine synthase (glutamine-hydrolyzing) [Algibacter mikhailovii]GGZ81008.1 asparagine synthetase B [Algibacter mikhailovii]
MCGIHGEFFNKRSLTPKEQFLVFNDKNYHRGPDLSGYWSNSRNCQLGFRRLSILDLSALGNQPMKSQNGKYVMVFNGEIYNFVKLRETLVNHGYIFKTTTDSEVLVNCFEHYGVLKTLDLIDGMFAVALYDTAKDKLILARDFAGIKPLFYSFKAGQLVFGSRYDQISKHHLNKDAKIDKRVLKTYLAKHYVPAPLGILENTYQAEPGQIVEVEQGQLKKTYYWRLPEKIDEADLITDKDEALELIKTSLKDAVSAELMADVPLGSFLSGGIDSPLITYFAKKLKPDVTAYSIGSDSVKHDESEDASAYAALIGCDFNIDNLDSKLVSKFFLDAMAHLKEPFADFSLIPAYALTKGAKKRSTVMLSGDGGDELFFGYERFYSVIKNLPYKKVPLKLRYFFYGLDKALFRNKHVNSCFLSSNLSKAHENLHSRFRPEKIHATFPNLNDIELYDLACYDYKNSSKILDMLHEMRKAEFYDMMQKTLTKVDRMSMANSLEVRVPFLKKSFIETALKIHPNLSYGANKKKQILKDLLRSVLPKSPINNVKRGFSVPLGQWIREDLKQVIYDAIFEDGFIKTFEIDKIALKHIWDAHQTGGKDNKWSIFTIYSLAAWHDDLKK